MWIDDVIAVAPETTTWSAIVRCPLMPAPPPIMQCAPITALPGDADAARDRRVIADAHVVADLHLVVDLHAPADDGVASRATVDAAVGADLDVVADDDPAELLDLHPLAAIGREAEAVGTDDRARPGRSSARRASSRTSP